MSVEKLTVSPLPVTPMTWFGASGVGNIEGIREDLFDELRIKIDMLLQKGSVHAKPETTFLHSQGFLSLQPVT